MLLQVGVYLGIDIVNVIDNVIVNVIDMGQYLVYVC